MTSVNIQVHTGHQPTIDAFIASMTESGYQLASNASPMRTLTGTVWLRFHRPAEPAT
jgi:hypothetical protein